MRRTKGFTLAELMVVILILGVLIALLLPAINGAVKTARDATVTAEVNQLATALADFKSKYGKYPPSRVILREDGVYNPNDFRTLAKVALDGDWHGNETITVSDGDLTYGELATRSYAVLKSLWPRAHFVQGVPSAADPIRHDFNGSGAYDRSAIYLEGHECLVFFLGGVPLSAEFGGPGLSGFANNPTHPFSNASKSIVNPLTGVVALAASSNRTQPMMEFRPSRLVDNDGDGMPGYVDTLETGADARYYAFFSTNGGGGYDPNDVNFSRKAGELAVAEPDDSPEYAARYYKVGFRQDPVSSAAPNPYTTSVPTLVPTTNYVNPDGYQLFSAGRDGLYGLGGQYSPNSSVKLPPDVPGDARRSEGDNLSNFANGHID